MHIVAIKKPNNKHCVAILSHEQLKEMKAEQDKKPKEEQYLFKLIDSNMLFEIRGPKGGGFVEDHKPIQVGQDFDSYINPLDKNIMDFTQSSKLSSKNQRDMFFVRWEDNTFSIAVCPENELDELLDEIGDPGAVRYKEFNMNMFFSMVKETDDKYNMWKIEFDGIFEKGIVFNPEKVCKRTGYTLGHNRFLYEAYEDKITLGALTEKDFSFDLQENASK